MQEGTKSFLLSHLINLCFGIDLEGLYFCPLQPFFSIDSEVQWPERSSHDAELGSGGETIVRSEEGRAALMLSPSGEEFSVEFTCSLSRTQNRHDSTQGFRRDSDSSPGNLICQTTNEETKEVHQGRRSRRNESVRSRSSSPRISSTAQPKVIIPNTFFCTYVIALIRYLNSLPFPWQPEETFQSTAVVQHHSCCTVAPVWCYPLSLARQLWTARISKPEDVGAEGAGVLTQALSKMNMSDTSSGERKSCLPQALPLTCPSPHRHRLNNQLTRIKH